MWRIRKVIFSHSFVIIQEKTSPICPHTYINMYTYRYDYVLVTCFIAVANKYLIKSNRARNSLKK